jgi:hypothetical protein
MSPAQVIFAINRMREVQIDNARIIGLYVARATWGDGKQEK